jgi:hypothetical protein
MLSESLPAPELGDPDPITRCGVKVASEAWDLVDMVRFHAPRLMGA